MSPEPHDRKLQSAIHRQVQRKRGDGSEPQSIFEQTAFLGTLGLLFAVPVILLAYLGLWLDGLSSTYSARWTVSLILLGMCIGAFNVYLFVREH